MAKSHRKRLTWHPPPPQLGCTVSHRAVDPRASTLHFLFGPFPSVFPGAVISHTSLRVIDAGRPLTLWWLPSPPAAASEWPVLHLQNARTLSFPRRLINQRVRSQSHLSFHLASLPAGPGRTGPLPSRPAPYPLVPCPRRPLRPHLWNT